MADNKYNGGRPPKDESEKAINKVTTNLTEGEFSLLVKWQNDTGQPRSLIIRNALMKELKSEYKEPRKFTIEEVQFIDSLTRLNSTLNQIAKKMNSNLNLSGIDEVKMLSSISKIQSEIILIKEKL